MKIRFGQFFKPEQERILTPAEKRRRKKKIFTSIAIIWAISTFILACLIPGIVNSIGITDTSDLLGLFGVEVVSDTNTVSAEESKEEWAPDKICGPYTATNVTADGIISIKAGSEKYQVKVLGSPDMGRVIASGVIATPANIWIKFGDPVKDEYGRLLAYVYYDEGGGKLKNIATGGEL